MTDYPRYEPVKGPPDVAHRGYHGGRVVDLVFHLVDRWRAMPPRTVTPELDPASGSLELHERLPARPASSKVPAPEHAYRTLAPDERFARDFLLGSARSMKLQAGLLVGLVVLVVLLLVQGVAPPDRPAKQTAQRATPAAAGSPNQVP